MDSDPGSDSDFYGDEKTTASLLARIDDLDEGWQALGDALDISLPKRNYDLSSSLPTTGQLRNPYQGVAGAWQLTETVDDFLARLPPSKTDMSVSLPWIQIVNPFAPPADPAAAAARFGARGMEKLHELSDAIDAAQSRRTTTTTTTASGPRKGGERAAADAVAPKRQEVVAELHSLAVECGLVGGKWMLFPSPEDVDDVWGTVARATARNDLGCAAKVAPRDPEKPWKERLVCVYTNDFRDKRDVARVLQQLRKLRLVEANARRRIYYKCEAWTELGLASDNKWGIKASMYDSNEMFTFLKNHGTG